MRKTGYHHKNANTSDCLCLSLSQVMGVSGLVCNSLLHYCMDYYSNPSSMT